MISQMIKKGIEKSVKSLFSDLGIAYSHDLKINIKQPALLEHGDYSTNISMLLAKDLRMAPLHIANMLKNKLEQEGKIDHLVNKIEIANPGFINMFIDWNQWAQTVFFERSNTGEKVVLEHTSINPNKSAHIGHLRNSCIGDTLVRLLKRIGFTVEVHNYIDDLGNQLADTVVGILNTSHKQEHSRFGESNM